MMRKLIEALKVLDSVGIAKVQNVTTLCSQLEHRMMKLEFRLDSKMNPAAKEFIRGNFIPARLSCNARPSSHV